jgi:nucleoside-diphosphate-sugar epimerase
MSNSEKTKVLIIGSNSMVGQRIQERLGIAYSVFTAGRDSYADVNFDLTKDTNQANGQQFDVVIHCAASFSGNDAQGMIANELTNSVGSMHAGNFAMHAGCKHFVYLSSIFIYDHPNNGYFGSYGLSKRHGQENLDLLCRGTGMLFTSLLLPQIYDERGLGRKHQPLFYRIVDCAKSGADVMFYGKHDALRNFLFVGDIAEIIEKVIVRNVSGIFPCVHPISNSLSQIANIAFDVFGKGGKVVFQLDKPNIPDVYIPPIGELYELIDYQPETSLHVGIRKMLGDDHA